MSSRSIPLSDKWINKIKDRPDTAAHIAVDLIQDTITLLILSILFGRLIERLFFPEENTPHTIRNKSTLMLAILVYAQLLIDVVAVYFIRGIVRRIPPLVGQGRPREMTDVEMSLIIALVFIACQPSLLLRINALVHRF